MNYSVRFKNLVTELSVNPTAIFKSGNFISTSGVGEINPKNGITYLHVNELEVNCTDRINDADNEFHDHIQCLLMQALYLAEEMLTAITAFYQADAYFEKPIRCVYNDKEFELRGYSWEESRPIMRLYGGKFADDLSFLDVNMNAHPMFHLYRIAKDNSLPSDYRILNAWRFLEAYYGLQGRPLLNKLYNQGQDPAVVKEYYELFRSAVAHATDLLEHPYGTDKVIVPNTWETEYNGSIYLRLSYLLEYLDSLVKNYEPKLIDPTPYFPAQRF